jgi:hypothetical protein
VNAIRWSYKDTDVSIRHVGLNAAKRQRVSCVLIDTTGCNASFVKSAGNIFHSDLQLEDGMKIANSMEQNSNNS